MGKIDNWFIEQFDKGTTIIQKKGWLPLNTLIMGAECLFWGGLVAVQKMNALGGLIICSAAVFLTVSFFTWKNAIGYWENHRKTLELNARVLLWREENVKLRYFTLGLFVPFTILNAIELDLIGTTSDLAILAVQWLRCCKYLGPGNYARQQQTKLSGLPQGS